VRCEDRRDVDVTRPTYDKTNGRQPFVEVSDKVGGFRKISTKLKQRNI